MRSGLRKSDSASPSFKNSGFADDHDAVLGPRLDVLAHALVRADRHRALQHQREIVLGGLGDLLGDLQHVRQVRRAVFGGRGADGHEHDLAILDRFGQVGAEVEAVRPIALDQRGEAGLEERHLAGAQLLELLLVDVDTGDVRA